jgi:ubiquinone biosynthesis protein Coq4
MKGNFMNTFEINSKNIEPTAKLKKVELSPRQKMLICQKLNQDPRTQELFKQLSAQNFEVEKFDSI